MLINKKQVKMYVKEHNKHISQIDKNFYDALNRKLILALEKALQVNASRKRLTGAALLF